ncbi:restriction endonuclease subunit S [Yersinia similis]|uniref:restriction endonuclease subunit S n=1 Tax=Yersinia similis TaxID=367190 RepID=UPI00061C11A7|nr:restriction endonuclease subunit S [Yersinia similis]CNB44127.1 restriction modification enzyme [Yersinia similis]
MVNKSAHSDLELMQARIKMVPSGWVFSYVGRVFSIKNNLRKPISEDVRAKNVGKYPYFGPTKIQGYIDSYEQDGSYALIGEDGDHFLKYENQSMTQLIDGRCTVNNHAHIIEGTSIATREWFYYYFMHRDIFSFLSRQGAGRYKLNKASLEKIPLIIPPFGEQKKIAQILSAWDKAIATTEKLLINSQRQKNALMQQILIGKRRFLKKNKDCTYKNTKYGKLPSDWDYVALKDICYQVSERNNSANDYPVLSCSKYDGFVDSLRYFKKKVYSDDTSGYRVIPFGAFGFPSNHIEEGSIGLQTLYDFGLVSPIYVVFKANDKKVNNEYLYALLKTEHYRQIFSAATNASVDRRGSLRWKEFSMIHVPLPSRDEQDKIALTIKVASSEIAVIQKKLEYLKQEKKALMQQLLTGKRRVKVEAA